MSPVGPTRPVRAVGSTPLGHICKVSDGRWETLAWLGKIPLPTQTPTGRPPDRHPGGPTALLSPAMNRFVRPALAGLIVSGIGIVGSISGCQKAPPPLAKTK